MKKNRKFFCTHRLQIIEPGKAGCFDCWYTKNKSDLRVNSWLNCKGIHKMSIPAFNKLKKADNETGSTFNFLTTIIRLHGGTYGWKLVDNAVLLAKHQNMPGLID